MKIDVGLAIIWSAVAAIFGFVVAVIVCGQVCR
jgi:hypothetical protein